MSDVPFLSGISGLSFDSPFLLIFFLLFFVLLFVCLFVCFCVSLPSPVAFSVLSCFSVMVRYLDFFLQKII